MVRSTRRNSLILLRWCSGLRKTVALTVLGAGLLLVCPTAPIPPCGTDGTTRHVYRLKTTVAPPRRPC